jgi:peptidoglycan lytic transglycosylase B
VAGTVRDRGSSDGVLPCTVPHRDSTCERLYTEEVRAACVIVAVVVIAVETADLKVRPTLSASQQPQPASQEPSPPAAQQPSPPTPPSEQTRPSFSEWLAELRAEAIGRGLREDTVDKALATVDEPLPVVLERDRAQAEIVLPLETYIARQTRPSIVRSGRQMAARHADLLKRIDEHYAVPPNIIMAVWGIESNFGRFTGVRPIVGALATLAWDPRRSTLFRNELFSALEILDRGYIELANMRGSWAGAMGQPQFMPSSYLKYAEDFDGDSRRDIWKSPADIFASIANYLKGSGWVDGERWGREVKLSPDAKSIVAADVARREDGCRAQREMTVALPLSEWQRIGVRQADGTALPKADLEASLVSGATRHFLVYRNYDVLLDYNCAHAYALSVGLLSDRVAN